MTPRNSLLFGALFVCLGATPPQEPGGGGTGTQEKCCRPGVRVTESGGTCEKPCAANTVCTPWQSQCTMLVPGGCGTTNGTCTEFTLAQVINYISDCDRTECEWRDADHTEPIKWLCQWSPSPTICGTQNNVKNCTGTACQ
jgi:hypothetical protein